MSNYSRRLKVLADDREDVAADPIPEFCRRFRLGVATYYKLPPDLRPREIRIGKKVLISREAATEWQRMMEARTTEGAA